MKNLKLALIIMLAQIVLGLFHSAIASENDFSIVSSDEIAMENINQASKEEMKKLNECMVESEEKHIDDTACVNDVFGDIY